MGERAAFSTIMCPEEFGTSIALFCRREKHTASDSPGGSSTTRHRFQVSRGVCHESAGTVDPGCPEDGTVPAFCRSVGLLTGVVTCCYRTGSNRMLKSTTFPQIGVEVQLVTGLNQERMARTRIVGPVVVVVVLAPVLVVRNPPNSGKSRYTAYSQGGVAAPASSCIWRIPSPTKSEGANAAPE